MRWLAAAAIASGQVCPATVSLRRSCFDGHRAVRTGVPFCYQTRTVIDADNKTAHLVECSKHLGTRVPGTGNESLPATCTPSGEWETELQCEAFPRLAYRLRNTGALISDWWVQEVEFLDSSCRKRPKVLSTFSSTDLQPSGTYSTESAFDGSLETGWHARCSGDGCTSSSIGVVLHRPESISCIALRQFKSGHNRADEIALEVWKRGDWRLLNTWTGLREHKDDVQFLKLKRDCDRFEATSLYSVEGVGVGRTPHMGEGKLMCAQGLTGKKPIVVYCNDGVWHPEHYDLQCNNTVEYFPLEGVQYGEGIETDPYELVYTLTYLIAAVFMTMVFFLSLQKMMRREEKKRRRTEAALKARVTYFENILGYSNAESEDDLEKPRHERKSSQRLLADASKPMMGDGLLRQTVGKATVVTKGFAKRVTEMRGDYSAKSKAPDNTSGRRSRRPPPLQSQEEVDHAPGYVASPSHSPASSMASSPIMGPQSPEGVGRPADPEKRPGKLPPPPAAAERRPAHLGPPRAHERHSGTGETSPQQRERARVVGATSPSGATAPAAKSAGRPVYAKAAAKKASRGLGRS